MRHEKILVSAKRLNEAKILVGCHNITLTIMQASGLSAGDIVQFTVSAHGSNQSITLKLWGDYTILYFFYLGVVIFFQRNMPRQFATEKVAVNH